ncbi:hypothetical protein [Kocuria sp.]|uniref:hypothetical protein n=1 Tax=Kocuria sp. TaxID=1871328 RepID=UPI0026E0F802|nr:hypothetical protein [Kocuria sp.]MDO5366834.1 hypothetical protein [Kocuria sp.]
MGAGTIFYTAGFQQLSKANPEMKSRIFWTASTPDGRSFAFQAIEIFLWVQFSFAWSHVLGD